MQAWLQAAVDYIPQWMALQMRATERPGVSIAIRHRGETVLRLALGHASLADKVRLTPRHRFRIGSISKSFTAAGILKLREQGLLRLDDAVGQHVSGLHPRLAEATLTQLLSHSAGMARDGADSSYFQVLRPFPGREELQADWRLPPAIDANSRVKYSNHGFALLGLVIEAVTGEPYARWMLREIIQAAGLRDTLPDATPDRTPRTVQGHSGRLLLGSRVQVPGDRPTHAIAAAGGFVSTAEDVAAFSAQLLPGAAHSVLSVSSRRELLRQKWPVPHNSPPLSYGLGLMHGSFNGWDWLGHTGSLDCFVSRALVLPRQDLSMAVLCNSVDGFSWPWTDGLLQILQTFERHGAPSAATRGWSGRFWSLFGATDLVPVKDRVFAIAPALALPFTDATELTPRGKDRAVMNQANGFASFGEPARLERDRAGRITALWLGGSRNVPEATATRELRTRLENRAET